MILNNYLAMRKAQEIAGSGDRLVPDHVLELHRIVTDGTLPDESESGRLQEPGEDRVVVEWGPGQVLHVPPPAEDLPARLEQFCAWVERIKRGDTLTLTEKREALDAWYTEMGRGADSGLPKFFRDRFRKSKAGFTEDVMDRSLLEGPPPGID